MLDLAIGWSYITLMKKYRLTFKPARAGCGAVVRSRTEGSQGKNGRGRNKGRRYRTFCREIREQRERKGGMRGPRPTGGFCSLGKMYTSVCVCGQRGRS